MDVWKPSKKWLFTALLLLPVGILGVVFILPADFSQSIHSEAEVSSEFYPIKQFKVVSTIKELNQADIDKVIQPYIGQSFWRVPLQQLQAELTRLDWVFRAEVRRVWPDMLLIRIQEQEPVVRWKEFGLLNNQGELFYPKSIAPFERLVVLSGDELRSRDLLKVLAQLQQALDEGGWVIRRLSEQVDGVWRLELTQGLVLWLDPEDWQHKIKRWLIAYQQVSKESRKVAEEIDLRYSNGFVIKQHSEQQLTSS